MREELWNQYAFFLLDSINFHNEIWYDTLLYLHHLTFIVKIDRDVNRVSDAIYERMRFFNDSNDILFDNDEASVLEVLVAFVRRISDEYIPHYNFDGEDMTFIIFESFLRNLHIYPDEYEQNVKEKLNFWMERMYKNDGFGSIMPLENPKNDYKMTEIWSQFFIFLSDHSIKSWEDFEKFL